MRLSEWQHKLQAAILDIQAPEADFLAGDKARLDIYRRAYRLRLIEALQADYPKLCAWLGEEAFAESAQAYLAAFPSHARSIRWVGQHLAQFLRKVVPWKERLELSEMAQFEWTLGLAFDSAEAECLAPLHLAQIPPPRWPKLRFKLHPSVHLLTLAYPVPQAWKSLEAGSLPECQRLEHPITWLIWRQNYKVFFRSLAEPERFALEAIQAGQAFADLCAGLTQWGDLGDLARYAAVLLQRWLAQGLLVAIE